MLTAKNAQISVGTKSHSERFVNLCKSYGQPVRNAAADVLTRSFLLRILTVIVSPNWCQHFDQYASRKMGVSQLPDACHRVPVCLAASSSARVGSLPNAGN